MAIVAETAGPTSTTFPQGRSSTSLLQWWFFTMQRSRRSAIIWVTMMMSSGEQQIASLGDLLGPLVVFQVECLGCERCRVRLTLQALLSSTFFQTLPDLVTPLKGHSLTLYFHAAVQQRSQRPLKGSGTNRTVEAT